MPAPRSKPLLAWEPLPFLVLVGLLLLTGWIRPDGPPAAFWLLVVLVLAALAWLVVSLVRASRRANPDQWGDLATLEGLDVVDAPHRDREVRAVVPVEDANRHQAAIELARLYGGTEQHAVLVPRANRWLSRRYRIGVQLVGGDRPRHAGFLATAAAERWVELLDGLRQRGTFVRVPAIIVGDSRPHKVDLDLSGLDALEG
ncbi:hypothetical protein J2X63_000099 [Agromyces sp. 3263]|uniref:hypothetical protein n=1 Tax=Agromyces sp. 3263 TaxID=2817750 RepID=UPI0028615580|nr:hypothetical protein [Agromyces sp. 3263]MDR6904413.1 hypothetical protein [Agromyces sp. 3263]